MSENRSVRMIKIFFAFINEKLVPMFQKNLAKLYNLKIFRKSKPPVEEQSVMSYLRTIKIDAPEDFSANFDTYLSGEKDIEPNFR